MSAESARVMMLLLVSAMLALRWHEHCPPLVTLEQDSAGEWIWVVEGTTVGAMPRKGEVTRWLALGRRVPINTATVEELQQVPGIGPGRSAAIVSFRRENGNFDDLSSLMSIKGIGPKTTRTVAPFLDVGVM